jgi:glycosyltransferase involved in cell wall biosynthesis
MTDEHSLISIIVPVYNVEKYVYQCVKSIFAQSFKNWELILVNDGSTDNSGFICDELSIKDSRVKVVHQKNAGVSIARNNALNIANGDYITFIDSDDWIEEDYLLSFMKYSLSDDSIVCQSVLYDYEHKIDKVAWRSDVEYIIDKSKPDQEKEIWHSGVIWSKLFSSKVIDDNNLRFDENLRLHEDHIFYYNYLLHIEKIILLSYAGYHYMHRDRVSLSKKLQSSKAYFLSSDMFLEVYPKLENHFGAVKHAYVADCIQSFGLNQVIMGVFGSYLENRPKPERYKILERNKKYKLLFKKYYHNKTLKTKFFYVSYMFLPVFLQDFIFKFVSKIFGQYLKTTINIR